MPPSIAEPETPAPSSDVDLFSDAVLDDPFPVYRDLRDRGSAVRLTAHDVLAVTRHADVRTVLTDADTFTSVDGIALTDTANRQLLAGTVLGADGTEHARLRKPLSRRLNPRAMRGITDAIRERVARLTARYTSGGAFDAAELAQHVVADIVMDLMGLPEETREQLIHGAAATFDVFGPDNDRYRASAPVAAGVIRFLHEQVSRDTVAPDSWMSTIYEAADAGELDEADVVPLMSAYTTAGMDTTIYAVSAAIHLLATHPEQYAELRDGRASGADAFHEAIRLEAPVQGFGRRARRDTTLGGVPIAAGEQLWVIYGSAGRDPRAWGADADAFRVLRPGAADHLALGAGPHTCAGNHLAVLEAGALLEAVASRCPRLEPAGEPRRVLNNVLRGWASVPVRVG